MSNNNNREWIIKIKILLIKNKLCFLNQQQRVVSDGEGSDEDSDVQKPVSNKRKIHVCIVYKKKEYINIFISVTNNLKKILFYSD